MATLPGAKVTVSAAANALAGGTGYCVVIGCVSTSADTTPRVFTSSKSLITQHGYSKAVDYACMHLAETGKPVIFIGIPVGVSGKLYSLNNSLVGGTSAITVAPGSAGYLDDFDVVVTVTNGGTIGTSGIVLSISLDGGLSTKTVRLGTATTYTIPYSGITLNFSTGTLVTNDTLTFSTLAPTFDSAGLTAAKAALASQLKLSRSWMVIGDVYSSTQAGYVVTAINAYETTDKRFTYARMSLKDRLISAKASKRVAKVNPGPSLTFAEVGATGDTITRATGSWITDGFAVGQTVAVTGSSSNNFTGGIIGALTATVLTLTSQDLTPEVTTAATVYGADSVTFAEVGAVGDTITRTGGSWLDEGFSVGSSITITGTTSNNLTNAVIAGVTDTVITLGTDDLTAETAALSDIIITGTLTKSSYISQVDSAYASVTSQKRVDVSVGSARKQSPVHGYLLRRPAAWAASIREYQHDVHHPTWAKADGPLDGFSILDANGNLVEYDERVDGGALAANFTCFRTWGNGPVGTFLALSLTRDVDGSILQATHNLAVANVACTVVQTTTENIIGQVLQLNANGTATSASLQRIEEAVNTALEQALLREFVPGEGPRASKAVWKADATTDLSGVGATLLGVVNLVLNGTVYNVDTLVKVS